MGQRFSHFTSFHSFVYIALTIVSFIVAYMVGINYSKYI